MSVTDLFKKKVESSKATRFEYSAPGMNLNFTLRTDIVDELKRFEPLLIEALGDIQSEIAKFSERSS